MKHFRHRKYNRIRYQRKFRKWLTTQATRLGKTPKEVFDTYLIGQGMSMADVGKLSPAPVNSVFTMTQLANANQVFQRTTSTGGDASKGAGTIPVTINVTQPGPVKARIRAADGTTILGYSDSVNVSSIGPQTVKLTGIAARLGWFYVDLTGDGTTYQNGTTLVGMGRVVAFTGQSQVVRLLGLLAPVTRTLTTAGLTPSPNSSMYARYTDSGRTVSTPHWATPAVSTDYDNIGAVTFLNLEVAKHAVNCAIVGHAVGATKISEWQPGQQYHTELLAVLDAVGGFETLYWHLGGTDAQAPTPAATYKAGVKTFLDSLVSHNVARGSNYNEILTSTGTRTGTDVYTNVQSLRVAVKQLASERTNAFYSEPHDYSIGDTVHQNSDGAVSLAKAIHRASNAKLAGQSVAGPVLVSGVRSGANVTLTATLPAGATALAIAGTPAIKFQVYPTGVAPTTDKAAALAISSATVSGNTITLVLAAVPTTGLDVYYNIYPDYNTNGTDNNTTDNYTADGITYGRMLEPTTSGPIQVAA